MGRRPPSYFMVHKLAPYKNFTVSLLTFPLSIKFTSLFMFSNIFLPCTLADLGVKSVKCCGESPSKSEEEPFGNDEIAFCVW